MNSQTSSSSLWRSTGGPFIFFKIAHLSLREVTMASQAIGFSAKSIVVSGRGSVESIFRIGMIITTTQLTDWKSQS
ncbi:hypothetical protein F8388_018418 [Cannabis sativa]|uniref:Uncharacterized protein n=1 Tax=Cannabis sativa TaxID=3483 RepID=A0A7J6DWT6_CANSA|nr:hypothetical protein F8388_018418 [Cannabis sativa]